MLNQYRFLNSWEAVCESQCSRGRPSITLLLKELPFRAGLHQLLVLVPKADITFAPFFLILRLINTANANAQVDIFKKT